MIYMERGPDLVRWWHQAYTLPTIKTMISNTRTTSTRTEWVHQNLVTKIIAKPPRKKLPHVRPIAAGLIPLVECFAFVELGCRNPEVMFSCITEPTD
jgi:hypothetical protein